MRKVSPSRPRAAAAWPESASGAGGCRAAAPDPVARRLCPVAGGRGAPGAPGTAPVERRRLAPEHAR